MTTAIIVLALVIAAVMLYSSLFERHYKVCRSLTMTADRERVFEKLRDLASWDDWSPWLLHEPTAKRELADEPTKEGGWYTWDGQEIGAGKLTHVKLVEPEYIKQRIEFRRPFKSAADVTWELADKNGETEVTWCIRGEMPLHLGFLTPMVKRMLVQDYDLGLLMLRSTLDPEAERPEIRFAGEAELPTCTALTIPFKGELHNLIAAMKEGLPKLVGHVRDQGTPIGPPFSVYYKANPKTMHFDCDMAMPVDDRTPDGEFERKEIPGGNYYKVEHRGSYDFLGLAWYSAMSHLQMSKTKMDRSRPSFEFYENDPNEVAHSNEILTTLYIPVR